MPRWLGQSVFLRPFASAAFIDKIPPSNQIAEEKEKDKDKEKEKEKPLGHSQEKIVGEGGAKGKIKAKSASKKIVAESEDTDELRPLTTREKGSLLSFPFPSFFLSSLPPFLPSLIANSAVLQCLDNVKYLAKLFFKSSLSKEIAMRKGVPPELFEMNSVDSFVPFLLENIVAARMLSRPGKFTFSFSFFFFFFVWPRRREIFPCFQSTATR